MKLLKKLGFVSVICFWSAISVAQETLPIYSDYLSDNVYLLHPAAAGIGNAGKIRMTSRTQWQGVADAPALQTLSFHNRYGNKMGLGVIVFNDKNGYHSQKGIQGTYAYHLNLSRWARDFEQLSFGLSMTFVQNQFDKSIFTPGDFDPVVADLKGSDGYFNGDFGMSYHKNKFFSYLTIKNLFLTTKTDTQIKPLNLRKFLVSAGYFFGEENSLQFEPSLLAIYEPHYERTQIDANLKVYKKMGTSTMWAALSYRRSIETGGLESLQSITPIIGVNYKNYMFSYTYTEQLGDFQIIPKGGYHQLTFGIDVFVRHTRLAACPNITSGFNN